MCAYDYMHEHICVFGRWEIFLLVVFLKSSPEDMLIDFREMGRRERNIDVRNTSHVPYTSGAGVEPAT